jgi:hypothetical protein
LVNRLERIVLLVDSRQLRQCEIENPEYRSALIAAGVYVIR